MLKNPVVIDNQVQTKGTAIRGLSRPCSKNQTVGGTSPDTLHFSPKGDQCRQGRHFVVMDEHKISELFRSYFHNKMTLLLFLIQARKVKPSPVLVGTVHRFLDDMFRHMLEGDLQKRYRLTFKWLRRFFEKLPDVSIYQRDKAKDFVRAVYDVMGMHLRDDV